MRKKLYIKIHYVVQNIIANPSRSISMLLSGYSNYLGEYLNLSHQINSFQFLENNYQSHG
ncbi:hypothetical protein OO013_00235 [Mangrovivirga sp. M17]|uniref:Uncharacterized protein n=1 Tax=Mangrovivirga halotolerans TaxID=2993936 RepID=A0ABT3RLC9_9BACT|nr:hypothetical protein [Mangrovivirga halotolerans]MCX2742266.1 hypothetical protein [Mangrovivirga halotolerans]